MDINEVGLGSIFLLAAILMPTVPRFRRSPSLEKSRRTRVVTLAIAGTLFLLSGVTGRDNLDVVSSSLFVWAVIMLAPECGGWSRSRVDAPSSEPK